MRFNRDLGGLEQLAAHTAAARERLGTPVLAACPFNHRGLLARKAAGKFGLLAYMATREVNRAQAAGLPPSFVLAITDEDVVALENRSKTTKPKLGDEVGRWRRGDLVVAATGGSTPYQLDVTLTPASGEPIQCCCGNTTISDAFLGLLSAPSMV